MPPASPYHPTKGQKTNQSTTITLSPSIVSCKAHSINNPINEESASESITRNNNKTVIKILNAMILQKKKSLTHNTTLVTSSPPLDCFDWKSSTQWRIESHMLAKAQEAVILTWNKYFQIRFTSFSKKNQMFV